MKSKWKNRTSRHHSKPITQPRTLRHNTHKRLRKRKNNRLYRIHLNQQHNNGRRSNYVNERHMAILGERQRSKVKAVSVQRHPNSPFFSRLPANNACHKPVEEARTFYQSNPNKKTCPTLTFLSPYPLRFLRHYRPQGMHTVSSNRVFGLLAVYYEYAEHLLRRTSTNMDLPPYLFPTTTLTLNNSPATEIGKLCSIVLATAVPTQQLIHAACIPLRQFLGFYQCL